MSWNPDSDPAALVHQVLSTRIFADPTGRIAAALHLMGGLWERLGVPVFNLSPIFSALIGAGQALDLDPGPTGDVLDQLTRCEHLLAAAQPSLRGGVTAATELASSLPLARFGLESAFSAALCRGPELRRLLTEHIRCWLARARPGGLLRSLTVAQPTMSEYGIDPATLVAEAAH